MGTLVYQLRKRPNLRSDKGARVGAGALIGLALTGGLGGAFLGGLAGGASAGSGRMSLHDSIQSYAQESGAVELFSLTRESHDVLVLVLRLLSNGSLHSFRLCSSDGLVPASPHSQDFAIEDYLYSKATAVIDRVAELARR